MSDGDNYNSIIWTIFSVAVIGSFINLYFLWTTKEVLEIVKLAQIYFGFLGLVYSGLLIEGFSQKKELCDSKFKDKLNYISARGIFEFFILLPLLLLYDFSIFNNLNINSIMKYLLFIFMSLTILLIIINWIRRDYVKEIKEKREYINGKKSILDHLLYWFLIVILSLLLIFFSSLIIQLIL